MEEFMRCMWKGHVMGINKLQVDDCWYNEIEGSICLVNGCQGDGFASIGA